MLQKPIDPAVYGLYGLHQEQQTKPHSDELHEALKSAINKYSQAYLVVDGLDEYPENERNILLGYLATTGASVMMTSRPHVNLGLARFPNLEIHEIKATETDMCQYIKTRIAASHRLSKHVQTQPELHDQIQSGILKNVDGMWVLINSLVLEYICHGCLQVSAY